MAISRWPLATQRFHLQWEVQGTKGMAGEQVVGAETQLSRACQHRALSLSSQGVTDWLKWAGERPEPRDPEDP